MIIAFINIRSSRAEPLVLSNKKEVGISARRFLLPIRHGGTSDCLSQCGLEELSLRPFVGFVDLPDPENIKENHLNCCFTYEKIIIYDSER